RLQPVIESAIASSMTSAREAGNSSRRRRVIGIGGRAGGSAQGTALPSTVPHEPERPLVEQVYVQKISHSYDGVRPAVSELSFQVKSGEVLALIGPNGAGKSTTLRILATLQRPDHGAVLWDGRDAWLDRQ